MPANKRPPRARRATRPAKPAPRRRAKTKALAVTDPVRRASIGAVPFASPLSVLEPLRRRLIDRQIDFLSAALAWSPAHIIAHQQAAFWGGFADGTGKSRPARASKARATPRKRARRK